MTQGPWSVKGIDPKARSIARERAQSRGVTLGQYLNTLLMDPDEEGGLGGPIQEIEIDDPPPRSAADSDLRRMSVEIDQLSQKLEASQTRSARAVSGLDKAILGLMGKVEVSGKAQLTALERVTRALGEIESTQTALRSRIESVESTSSNNATVSALKTLESALGRLAETVQERLTSSEQDNLDHRNNINDRVGAFSDRVDEMARGLEQAVTTTVRNTSTALSGRLDAMEQQASAAERRMEGALGRINDATSRLENLETKHERTAHESAWKQERALEANLAKSRQMSKEVLDKVEGIEEKSREAMNSLNDAVNRITERIARAERKSDNATHILERSVNELDDKVTRAASTRGQVEEFAQLQQAFQKRLDSLAEDIQRPIHAVRVDLERKLDEALRTSTVHPEKVERLERSLRQVQEVVQASEARQADAVEAMSLQIERLTRAVDDRLRAVEANKGDMRPVEEVRREMLRLADVIDARMGTAEAASRSATAGVDSLRGDIGRLNSTFDDRMKTLEQRSASAIDLVGQHVSQQMGIVSDRLQRRQDEAVQRLTDRISDQALEGRQLDPAEIDRLADRLDERVRDSERRSAEAIGQIGEQVARVADRLQSQHQDSLRNFESKLAESGRSHETRLTELMADMQRRMDDVGEQAVSAVQPMHNTISSLARRLEAVEDGSRNQHRAPEPAVSRDIPAMQDDFVVLEDDEPSPQAPPALAAMAAVEAAENGDVIGVEPPPFDRTRDNMLFDDGAKSKDVVVMKAEPANEIDDLLDTDDVIFGNAFGKAPAREKANEFVADLPSDNRNSPADQAYIEAARRAAREGRRVDTAGATTRKGMGKGPVIVGAALAVAVAGGGALTVMRGKQDAKPDDFAKLDPSSPAVAAGNPEAAASDLFAPDTASHTEVAPTVASEAATAAELFGTTPGAPAAAPAPGAKPAAPAAAAAPGKAPAAAAAVPAAITLDDAVRNGDPVALHDKALELLQTGEKQRAVQMFKDASNRGLVMAEYRLAKLYEKGEGVPRDMAASRSWTEKAAIGGNTKAMHDLAVFYAEGDAGPQSYAAAVEWFRQASDHGLVDSQYNLAVLYEQGLGLTQDKDEAAYWFEVSGRAGDQDAARRARGLFADMPAAKAEQIKRRARAFSPKPNIARANGDFGRRAWDVAQPAQIAEIQRLLDRLGYNPGTSDGKMTAKTGDAIRAFERDNELAVTGEASVSLLRQMRSATLNAAD